LIFVGQSLVAKNHYSKALEIGRANAGWKQLYRDGSCVLFGRLTPDIQKIKSVTIDPAATPKSYFP